MKSQCGEQSLRREIPGWRWEPYSLESALAGRDKLTILADAPLSAFAGWIEQIIAESSGKHGKGILPVPLEPIGDAESRMAMTVCLYICGKRVNWMKI